MDWAAFKEITAFAAVIGTFVTGLFIGLPKAFRYYESRLQSISETHKSELKVLSDEYRKREAEQEARHRAEIRDMFTEAAKAREEDCKRFCDALAEITGQLKALENKVDGLKK